MSPSFLLINHSTKKQFYLHFQIPQIHLSRTTSHQPEPTPGSCGTLYGFSDYVSKITFTWGQPSNFQSGWYYKLYRSTTPIRTTTSRSYTYTPPSPTTTYTYKVACFNNDGIRGPYSYKSIKVTSGGGGPWNEKPNQIIVSLAEPEQNDVNPKYNHLLNFVFYLIIFAFYLLFTESNKNLASEIKKYKRIRISIIKKTIHKN